MTTKLQSFAQRPLRQQLGAILVLALSLNGLLAWLRLVPLYQQLTVAEVSQRQYVDTLEQRQRRLALLTTPPLADETWPEIEVQPSASQVVAELSHLARQHRLTVRQLEWVSADAGNRIELDLVGRFQSIGDFCYGVSEMTSLIRLENSQWQQLDVQRISYRAQVLGDWREENYHD
ncbi:hypothetical protein FCU94_00755 [Vibrio sp. JPW-9-11-11]|uniref:hypothetical protein n=1 Tax=Vibrio sp. JPW-9-11-11 TaxID=1416532 RepID=UPI001593A177|nr:hypothetical protein [Vibrio sp. JPW-9-11-11]NVD05450.1 hypothetical protein [Vibrio sp. JPW-9-11-11]